MFTALRLRTRVRDTVAVSDVLARTLLRPRRRAIGTGEGNASERDLKKRFTVTRLSCRDLDFKFVHTLTDSTTGTSDEPCSLSSLSKARHSAVKGYVKPNYNPKLQGTLEHVPFSGFACPVNDCDSATAFVYLN